MYRFSPKVFKNVIENFLWPRCRELWRQVLWTEKIDFLWNEQDYWNFFQRTCFKTHECISSWHKIEQNLHRVVNHVENPKSNRFFARFSWLMIFPNQFCESKFIRQKYTFCCFFLKIFDNLVTQERWLKHAGSAKLWSFFLRKYRFSRYWYMIPVRKLKIRISRQKLHIQFKIYNDSAKGILWVYILDPVPSDAHRV